MAVMKLVDTHVRKARSRIHYNTLSAPSMSEDDIRQLVHQLTFNYAKTYLTIDYQEYSRDLCCLLAPFFLQQVPLANPTAFTIPADPFDTLSKLHDIHQLPRYEERFKVKREAIQLLKQNPQSNSGPLKTERIMVDDACDFPGLREPFMVILTRHSAHAGPFGTQSVRRDSIQNSFGTLLLQDGIERVRDEAVQEPEISRERMLKTLWALDHEQLPQIRTLLKKVTDMRRPQLDYKNSVLQAFLHEDDPLPALIPFQESEFTPIFPRSRNFGHGKSQIGFEMQEQRAKELIQMLPGAKLGSDGSDPDISQASLEVVGGWHTLRVSSPISVASPTTSQEDDRIDQLFLENSPATDPMIGLMDERMEEIQIPRSRCIGAKHTNKAHILDGKTIGTFLPAMLKVQAASPLNDIKAEHCPPSPQSMLGQASMDVDAIESGNGHDDWNSFDMDIHNLCPIEDQTDIVMKVKLEEKDDTFMQVPLLASPNTLCPASFALPAKLQDLTQDGDEPYGRLRLKKNLKGLPALRLSLSWVTFTVDSPPSHQEASGVCAPLWDPAVKKDVDDLLNSSCLDGAPVSETRCRLLDEELLELLGALERESRPFIAVCRRTRQSFLQGSGFQDPPLSAERLGSDAGQLQSIGTERWESGIPLAEQQDESQYFDYEPSVLQFEDIIDSRMFYEPPTFEPASSIDVTLVPPVNDSAIPEANALLFDIDHTLVNADFEDSSAPDFSGMNQDSHISRLAEFTRLRAKNCGTTNVATIAADLPPSSSPINHSSSISDEIAATLMDPSTISLPETPAIKRTPHRYMASMDFVQRQAIVRLLRSPEWNVDLAERTSLDGVDLIVDPQSAIIVTSLFTLPTRGQQLVHRISEHSWRFNYLLVLLEAYPESVALKSANSIGVSDVPVISAYTPPILKAIRKLRRDVIIGEACGKKRGGCRVGYGFVNDVREAVGFVRYFGDMAEVRDESGGVLWEEREWLDLEMSLDEEGLAKLEGMNRMSAAILLCQVSVEEIWDMSPEERVQRFGYLIGVDAVNALNGRLKMMQSSEDESSYFVG